MQKTAYDMRRSDGSSDVGSSDLLTRIVFRSASILGTPIDAAGAAEIARRSRGTPRIANRLLRRARDYAEVRGDGQISASLAGEAMKLLAVDRSEEHTSELQSLMRISYAVFCLKKKTTSHSPKYSTIQHTECTYTNT